MKVILFLVTTCLLAIASIAWSAESITVEEFMQRVRERSPELAEQEAELNVIRTAAIEARVWPNP